MNDERRPARNAAATITTSRVAHPAVVIVLELEELPRVRIVAGSLEDEARLRRWLARSGVLRTLPFEVDYLLDKTERRAAA